MDAAEHGAGQHVADHAVDVELIFGLRIVVLRDPFADVFLRLADAREGDAVLGCLGQRLHRPAARFGREFGQRLDDGGDGDRAERRIGRAR